jgi:hypothetical protein
MIGELFLAAASRHALALEELFGYGTWIVSSVSTNSNLVFGCKVLYSSCSVFKIQKWYSVFLLENT